MFTVERTDAGYRATDAAKQSVVIGEEFAPADRGPSLPRGVDETVSARATRLELPPALMVIEDLESGETREIGKGDGPVDLAEEITDRQGGVFHSYLGERRPCLKGTRGSSGSTATDCRSSSSTASSPPFTTETSGGRTSSARSCERHGPSSEPAAPSGSKRASSPTAVPVAAIVRTTNATRSLRPWVDSNRNVRNPSVDRERRFDIAE